MILPALLVFFSCSGAAAPAKTLTILYTGDIYGVLGYKGWPGGLARRKFAVDQVRRENPRLLVLDVGNTLSPFTFSRLDQGQFMLEAMERMGYDALNLGSHEFDYGQERLAAIQRGFPGLLLLSSNVVRKDSGAPFAREFIIKEIDGIRVGIIGLCDPLVEQETIIGNFSGLVAQDPEAALRRLVPRLRPQVSVLVLLSNIPAERLLELLDKIEGIDVVVTRPPAGESPYLHRAIPTPYDFKYFVAASSTASAGPRVRAVLGTVSRYAFELGRVDVLLNEEGEIIDSRPSVVDLPPDGPESPELKEVMDERIRSIESRYDTITLLDRLKERLGRRWEKEDTLYLALRIMKDASRAEVAVINESGFYKLDFFSDDHIPRRDRISLMDVMHIAWTDNHLVRQNMDGRQLRALLRQNAASPRLHFLGLTMEADGSIWINGRPLQDLQAYTVAVSNYLAYGSHPWQTLTQGVDRKETFSGRRVVLRDLFTGTLTADSRLSLSTQAWTRRYDRRDADPYPTQWRASVERLELDLSNISNHNNAAFSAVPDARITSSNQLTLGSAMRAWLLLDHSWVAWKNEVNTAYSRVSLPNDVVNNPIDYLIFNSQVNGQAWRIPLGSRIHAVPSFLSRYDTEYTPTPGNSTRKVLLLQPGLSSTLGGWLDEVRVSAVSKLDFTASSTQHGAAFYSKFNKALTKPLNFNQEIEFFYYPASHTGNPIDMRWQGDFRNRLDVAVWRGFSLSAYCNVFAWRGELIRKTGFNVSTGVSLAFSRLWKIK